MGAVVSPSPQGGCWATPAAHSCGWGTAKAAEVPVVEPFSKRLRVVRRSCTLPAWAAPLARGPAAPAQGAAVAPPSSSFPPPPSFHGCLPILAANVMGVEREPHAWILHVLPPSDLIPHPISVRLLVPPLPQSPPVQFMLNNQVVQLPGIKDGDSLAMKVGRGFNRVCWCWERGMQRSEQLLKGHA